MLKSVNKEIKETARKVLSMTFYNAEKENATDVPDFLAYEILDLTELMSPDYSYHDPVIKEILNFGELSEQTKKIIRSAYK